MKTYKSVAFLSLSIIFLIACAGETVAPETGSLDIKVTIGPLCPVEPCTKTAAEITAIYEAYSFVISNKATKAVVLEQKLTYNGTNGVFKSNNIAVGEYELNINPSNIFTKKGFPIAVKIEKDKVTSLTVDIDTGIR